ncbi:hypothetical protein SDRG_15271 [Saprolegnia diclina VS20]|uniref:Secreted protein n=1 Tax=Saprolegnia diclina (strain VS20) TaxID=1156394 RepID=T0PNF2_SAPDV|nr:hypothetical protein SDRG_15271 [Saprolegnia diclina VS20]EQC26939.1 hypothetical protein SDRG_15271 [Saprolegnia diclina VS20]|eukprot:XP_008619660.1 hypothetical protein SDRG_15271 [Saprolegnia diclina VS20]
MGLHISVVLALSAMTLANNDVAPFDAAPSTTTSGDDTAVQDLPNMQWAAVREQIPSDIHNEAGLGSLQTNQG